MRDVVMVVDLQYGSTGKGQVAGTLGRKWNPDTVVCANGPNAGHTYRWTDGYDESDMAVMRRQVIHTVMPVTAVLPSVRNILLGPGAVIDMDRLQAEVRDSGDLLAGKRLIIHPMASVVLPEHREAEKAFVQVGSTMKGTAEAVIGKMRRIGFPPIARSHAGRLKLALHTLEIRGFHVLIDEGEYNSALDSSLKLMVEGAQGASLSMHSRFYPHCTSRDVSINQIWADCRLPARTEAAAWARNGFVEIVGVARTYPIRVANRFNEQGVQIGYSGDCYPDQREIPWADIGKQPELTTVTRLPRRLFTFSVGQIIDSVRYNAPTSLALTFCDYLPSHNGDHPDIPEGMEPMPVGPGERLSPCVLSWSRRLQAAAGAPVHFVSFGPNDTDLYRIAETPNRDRLSTGLYLPWVEDGE
jgi:adenylosuccinate synthase